MAKKPITSEKFVVDGRLAFARLDKPKAFQPGQDPRYEATFLCDISNAEVKKQVHAMVGGMRKIAKEFWGFVPYEVTKLAVDLGVSGAKLPEKRAKEDTIKVVCLFDGSSKPYDGFAGNWALQTHNKNRPALANRKGESVSPGETDENGNECFPYSGAHVRGKVTFWTQDNQFGKRINVNLVGVQFRGKGEKFGAGEYKAEDEFTPMEGDEAADADTPFGED